jgi:hypothetical protein
MTIVAAAVAPDGIVLAGDGRTTLLSGRRHRVASDHTHKVFAPFDGIGIATYGSALIGERTIAGLMQEFVGKRAKAAGCLVSDVSRDLEGFFTNALNDEAASTGKQPTPGQLGFIVAGYDDDGIGRIHEVLLPPVPKRGPIIEPDEVTTENPGVLFRGRTQHVRRLFEGYDRDGIAAAKVTLPAKLKEPFANLAFILNAPLSLQDALDLAMFVVRLTIDMERLTDGTIAMPEGIPACGGDVHSLLVSRTTSTWIIEPTLRPREAGQSEFG